MSFKMGCPHCKRTLNVTEKVFGKTVPCPGCSEPVTVPREPQPLWPEPKAYPLPAAQVTQAAPLPPTRNATPPMPPAMPSVPQVNGELDFLNDGRGSSPVPFCVTRRAEVRAVPQSKRTITVLTQIVGAVACVIAIIVGIWAYGHRPGNIEQALVTGGWAFNPGPYYVAMVFSVLLLVAGVVGSVRPERGMSKILLGVPIGFGILLLLVALVIPAFQAMRKAAERHGANAPTNSESGVLAQARNEIEAKLLHLNDFWYGYAMNPFGGFPTQLVEMKAISISADAGELDAADKANGIQWHGTIRIECELYRTVPVTIDPNTKAVRVVGKWGEWRDGGRKDTPIGKVGGVSVFAVDPFKTASPALDLTIRNARWEWCVNDAQKPDRSIIP